VRDLRSLIAAFALATLLAASGCASCNHDRLALTLPESLRGSEALILVADGAGDFRATSQALRQAIAAEKLPLTLEPFVWSHGYCRVLSDQLDEGHARREGQRLAETVLAVRRACPERPIYLVAHSAGSAVVLAAASALPADTIERIILFAPSVPEDYDLRPALRSIRYEVDVFSSRSDQWYLQASLFVSSIVHCRRYTAAGSDGFHPILDMPEDRLLYKKLRDFPWDPGLIWTGHDGGHFGYYQQGYLREFVLPLLRVQPPSA